MENEKVKPCTCKACGGPAMKDEYDFEHSVINPGTEAEYRLCNSCFDAKWDTNEITKCAGCGAWWDTGFVARDPDVDDFAACPECGKDICEGYSREEAIRLMEERKPSFPPRRRLEQWESGFAKNAQEMILEIAEIIRENRRLRFENNELRLHIAVVEAQVEAMDPGGDMDKFMFLSDIEVQNATYKLHKASGFVSSVEYIDDWEQKLAEFMASRVKGEQRSGSEV